MEIKEQNKRKLGHSLSTVERARDIHEGTGGTGEVLIPSNVTMLYLALVSKEVESFSLV